MTQPKSHDDNPMSVTALPPARRDSGKAGDDDLMDDGLLADRLFVDGQMLMTLEPTPSNPVTAVLAYSRRYRRTELSALVSSRHAI